jgi:hypothetical protein
MTLDEITDLPAHEGMLSFLQPVEDRQRLRQELAERLPAMAVPAPASLPQAIENTGFPSESSIAVPAPDDSIAPAMAVPPMAKADMAISPLPNTAIPVPAMVRPTVPVLLSPTRPPKVHRCASAQDGHSRSEHDLYRLLWESGSTVDPDTRAVQESLSRLAARLRMTQRNLQTLLDRLEQKLSLAIAARNNFVTGAPKTYHVFSPDEVVRRRQRAGLVWVVRNKGVQFVDSARAELIQRVHDEWTAGAIPSMEIPKEAMEDSALAFPPELRGIAMAGEMALARLWRECRKRVPGCTASAIVSFVREHGTALQDAPNAFAAHQRGREAAAEEDRRYWQSVLDDPHCSAHDRELARRYLEPRPPGV